MRTPAPGQQSRAHSALFSTSSLRREGSVCGWNGTARVCRAVAVPRSTEIDQLAVAAVRADDADRLYDTTR
jgi:hypothetical protein